MAVELTCKRLRAPRGRRALFALAALILAALALAIFASVLEPGRPRRRLLQKEPKEAKKADKEQNAREERPMRAVHVDLKGAPPKLDFLLRLWPLLRALGADALLLEYEDTFPFGGPLAALRAHNAFSEAAVRRLVAAAEEQGLHVIPLLQSFGHLEFALKLSEWAGLREAPAQPAALCPLRNGSWSLVAAMVDQVARLHPRARFLHIGADEVFELATCPLCRGKDRDALFLDHVRRVAQHVVRAHRKTPIMWDDMLRQMSAETIRGAGLHALGVEPMVWTYVRDIYRFVPEPQLALYGQLFGRVWAASAFKGAFGETLTLPDVRMHAENNLAWARVMRETRAHVRWAGIALTGWSRYDHLAALCELLPAAIPSLALNLLLVARARFEPEHVFRALERHLECPKSDDWFGLDEERALQEMAARDPTLSVRARDCRFPGARLFRLMETHAQVTRALDQYLFDVRQHKAWLTLYNERRNMSSPARVDEGLQEFAQNNFTLHALMRDARDALLEVYDRATAAEWIEQQIYPHVLKLEALFNASQALKRARVWPRRPLPELVDLKRRLDAL